MADETGKKISQLPLGENLADNDLMYAVEDGVSKKVKVSYLQDRIVGDVDSIPTADSGNLVSSGGVYNMVHTLDFNVFHNLAQISNSIADAFSVSESYSEGDYVVYDYSLYKFTADKSAGAWDSSKATPVAVVEELGSGGTSVVPNPSGEATDTLKKLKIDQTIYDFAASNVYGEASGAIASFSDGSNNPLVKLEADINPIQDLHGYDKPWAAGAGKNILDDSAIVFTSNSTMENHIATETEADTKTTPALILQAYNGMSYVKNLSTQNTPSPITFTKDETFTTIEFGHSGSARDSKVGFNIADLPDGEYKFWYTITSSTHPFKFGYFMITSTSETDATFAPYTNICPISGRSSVEVTRCGKNLFDAETATNGYIDADGNVISYNGVKVSDFIKILPNETYVLSYYRGRTEMTTGMRMAWYDQNKNFIQRDGGIESTSIGEKSISATCPSNGIYLRVSMPFDGIATNKNQLEKGSTATSYEAYNADTETISLGQTVYGGKLNVTTGELTVTHACDVVKNLTVAQGYTVGSKSVAKLYNLSNTSTSCEANQYHGAISNIAKELPAYFGALRVNETLPSNIGTYAISTDGIRVAVYDDDITMTETDFTSKYEDMQVCYPLVTPITITLTPTQVSSLLGNNNIWADSGDSDVVYIRDLNIAVNKLLEGDVYDGNEKVVGTYFGKPLYEKTVNVSSLSCTTSDYFGSYSGSLDLTGYIGNFEDVFVDVDMSYLTTAGGVKERFVLVQAPPNSTSINLFTCASRSNVTAVLTIKYTKSST